MITGTGHGGTDLGRRIREHREMANLSRQQTAADAGMAANYLTYLETSPDASPSPAALARLASALGTTVHAIAGAGVAPPPGCPVLEVLNAAQCQELLADGGVGRFLFNEARGPVAVPANFALLGHDIVFRTVAGTAVAAGTGQEVVSFEVDHLDEALGEGWSVLASGHAHTVTDTGELAEVTSVGVAPWAGGDHDTFVRLVPALLTGRRIREAAEPAASYPQRWTFSPGRPGVGAPS